MKRFKDYITERIDLTQTDITIEKGEPLYHGTLEEFDIKKIGTGGYDSILWTARDKKIARYYIPVIGGYTFSLRPRFIIKDFENKVDPWYTIITKQLGISDAKANALINKGWDAQDKGFKLYQKNQEYKKKNDELEKQWDLTDYGSPEFDKLHKELKAHNKIWATSEDEYAEYSKTQPSEYYQYFEDEIVEQLKKFDYVLTDGAYDKVYTDDKSKTLLSRNYRAKGKIVVLKPKRDMKFYNYAKGKEPDLMDLDYHKLGLFRKIEKSGYDGIIINDFAQSEYQGNYGHISYGFFKKSIKDCAKSEIKNQSHPKD